MGMRLKAFDGQPVRLVTVQGEVFEGFCEYNSRDYNAHEFGRDEAGLQIGNFLFFRNDIREAESLEGKKGPYGPFSEAYGLLETMNAEDGISGISEVLDSEDDAHVYRMLVCLEDWLDPSKGHELPDREEVIAAVRKVLRWNEAPEIRCKARELIDRWG